jgi:hypothetical protein
VPNPTRCLGKDHAELSPILNLITVST